ARAFGIPFRVVGMDVKKWTDENRANLDMNPANALLQLLLLVPREFKEQLDGCLPVLPEIDLVVGAGAILAAPTIAEAGNKPYAYIAYTPQAFRSRELAPFLFPFTDLPQPVNALLWGALNLI